MILRTRQIYYLFPNHEEHSKVELEQFIAVNDKANGNAAQLDDPENNNLNKVKVLIDDNEDEKY